MKKFFRNIDQWTLDTENIVYPYSIDKANFDTEIHNVHLSEEISDLTNYTQLAQNDLPPNDENGEQQSQNTNQENDEENEGDEEVTAEDIEELEATAAGAGGSGGGIDEAIEILFGNAASVEALARDLNLAPFVRALFLELEPSDFEELDIEDICSFEIDISFVGCFCQSCEMSLGEEFEDFQQYDNIDLSFNHFNGVNFLGLTITDGEYSQGFSIPIIGEVDCECPITTLQTDNYYIDSIYDLLEGDDFFFDCEGNCYSLVLLEDGEIPILQLEPCCCEIELNVNWTNVDCGEQSVMMMTYDSEWISSDPIYDFYNSFDWNFISCEGETYLEFSFMPIQHDHELHQSVEYTNSFESSFESIQFTVPDGMNCSCPIEELVIDYGMYYDYFYGNDSDNTYMTEDNSVWVDGFEFIHFLCYGGGFFQDCDGVCYEFNYDFENGYSIVEAECCEVSVNINLTEIPEWICDNEISQPAITTFNGYGTGNEDFNTYLSQALEMNLISLNNVAYLELSLTNCPCYSPNFDGTYNSEEMSLGEYFDQFQVCPQTIRIALPDCLDCDNPIIEADVDWQNVYDYLNGLGYGYEFSMGEYDVDVDDLMDALLGNSLFKDGNGNAFVLGYDDYSGEYCLDCWQQPLCVDLVGCMDEEYRSLSVSNGEFNFVTCVDGAYLGYSEMYGYGEVNISVPDSLSYECPIVELVIDYQYYNDYFESNIQSINNDYFGDSEFLEFLSQGGGIFYDAKGTCYELNYDYYNGWNLQECCLCCEIDTQISFGMINDFGSGIDWQSFDAGVQMLTMGEVQTLVTDALNTALDINFISKNNFAFLEFTYTDPLNTSNTETVRIGLPQNFNCDTNIVEMLIDFTELPGIAIQANNTNGFSGLSIEQVLEMIQEQNILFLDSDNNCYSLDYDMYSDEYCLEPSCEYYEVQNTVVGLPCNIVDGYDDFMLSPEDIEQGFEFEFVSCEGEYYLNVLGEFDIDLSISVPSNINCLNQITEFIGDFTFINDYLSIAYYANEYEFNDLDALNAIALGGGMFLDSSGMAYTLAYEENGYTLQECCDFCRADINVSFENINDYGADIPWRDFDLGEHDLTLGETADLTLDLINESLSFEVITCNNMAYLEVTYTDVNYLDNGFFNVDWDSGSYQQSFKVSLPDWISSDNKITDLMIDFTNLPEIAEVINHREGLGGLSLNTILLNMLETDFILKDEAGNIYTVFNDDEFGDYCIDYCDYYESINYQFVGSECVQPFYDRPGYYNYELEDYAEEFSFVSYEGMSFVLFDSEYGNNDNGYEYEGIHINVPDGINCLCPIDDLVLNQAFINDYLTKLEEQDDFDINDLDFLNAIVLGGGTFIDCEGTAYELVMDGYAQYSLQECCDYCDVNVNIGIDNLRFYGQDVDWGSFPSDFGQLTLGEVSEQTLAAINDVLDVNVIQCNNTSFIEFTYTDASILDEGFINTDWNLEDYQQSMRISLPSGFECDCEEMELLFDFYWVNQLATEGLNTNGFTGLEIEQFLNSIINKQAVLLDCNNDSLQLQYDDETGEYCFDWTYCFEEVNLNLPDTDPFDTTPAMTFVSIEGQSYLVFSEEGELASFENNGFPEDGIQIMVPDGLGCLCPIEQIVIDQDFFESYFDGDYPTDDESFLEFLDLGGGILLDCEGNEYQLSWTDEYGFKLEDFDDCEFTVNVSFDVLSDPWVFDFEDTSHAELESFADDILNAIDVTFNRADGISYLSISYTDPDNNPIIESINVFVADDVNCDNPISSLTLDYLTLYEYMDEEGLSDLEDFIDAISDSFAIGKFTDSLGNAYELDGEYNDNNLTLDDCYCEYDINMSLLNLDCITYEADEPPVGRSTFSIEQEGNEAYLQWSLDNGNYSDSAMLLLPTVISCLNPIENIYVDYGLFTDLYENESNTTIFDFLSLGGGVVEDSQGNFYAFEYDGQGAYVLADTCEVCRTDITIDFADIIDYGDPLPWQDFNSGYGQFTLGEVAQQVLDAFNEVVSIQYVSVNGLSFIEYTYTGGENPYGEDNSWADMFEGESVRISVPSALDCDCPIEELLFDFTTLATFVPQGLNTDGFTGLEIDQMLNGLINNGGIFVDCNDNCFEMTIDEETNEYCIDYSCCYEEVFVDIVGFDCRSELNTIDSEYVDEITEFTFVSCEGESALFFTGGEADFQENLFFDIEGIQIHTPEQLTCLNPIIDVVFDYSFLDSYFNLLDEADGNFNEFSVLTAISLGGAVFFDVSGTAYNMAWDAGDGFSLVESCNFCDTEVTLNFEIPDNNEDMSLAEYAEFIDSAFDVNFVSSDNLAFIEFTFTNQDVDFMEALNNDFEGVRESIRISVPDGLNCDCTLTALNFGYDTLIELYEEYDIGVDLEAIVFELLGSDSTFSDCNDNCYSLNFDEEYGIFCVDNWEQELNIDYLSCVEVSQPEGTAGGQIVNYSFGFASTPNGPCLLFNQSIDGPFARYEDGEYAGIKINVPESLNCECFIDELVVDYNYYADVYGFGTNNSTDFLTFLSSGGGLFFDCEDTCYTLEYDYYNGYSLEECCNYCEVEVNVSFTDLANYENNYEYGDGIDETYSDLQAMIDEFNESVDFTLISCEDNNFSFLEVTHTVMDEDGGYTDKLRVAVPQNIGCDCTIENLVLDYNVLFETQDLNGSFLNSLMMALDDGAGVFTDCNNNCIQVQYDGNFCLEYTCDSLDINVQYVGFDCTEESSSESLYDPEYSISFSNCEGESVIEFGYYDHYDNWQTVNINTPNGINCLCPVTNLIIDHNDYDNYFNQNPLTESGYEFSGIDMLHFLVYGGGIFADCDGNCYELVYDSKLGYTIQSVDATTSEVSIELFNQPTEPNGDITLLSYISSMIDATLICCDDITYLQLSYTDEMLLNFDFYGRENYSNTMLISVPEGIDCDCPLETLSLNYEYFSDMYQSGDIREQDILSDIVNGLEQGDAFLVDCNEQCYELSQSKDLNSYCLQPCDTESTEPLVVTDLPPVVIDLDGDGIELLGLEQGVQFDVDGDGQLEQTSWVGSDDAILVYDANGDGHITHVDELALANYHPDATTDLEGLALAFDSNQDGAFDASDDAWEQFGIWQDKNSDGITDAGEYTSLIDSNIVSINLTSDHNAYTLNGNQVYGTSDYTLNDGSTGIVGDVALSYSEIIEDTGIQGLAGSEAADTTANNNNNVSDASQTQAPIIDTVMSALVVSDNTDIS